MTPKELKKEILDELSQRYGGFHYAPRVDYKGHDHLLNDVSKFLSRYHDAIMEEVRGKIDRRREELGNTEKTPNMTDAEAAIRVQELKHLLSLLQPSEKKEEKNLQGNDYAGYSKFTIPDMTGGHSILDESEITEFRTTCNRCGLLKSTILATGKVCIGPSNHYFVDESETSNW